MKGKTILMIVLGITTLAGMLLAGAYFGYNNKVVSLQKQYAAEEKKVENRLDNMWKIISDKFQMKEEYAADFKEVAKVNVGAFTGNGEMFRWIQTQIPQIDPSIYREVMATIESQRLAMENSQNRIVDIVREHNTLLETVPSTWFIKSSVEPLEWEVISSKESKAIMVTREDERDIKSLKK